MKQTGLGRGLSALLPEADSKEAGGSLLIVSLKDIHPNPLQPRREFKAEELADLEASIREKGVIQPLIVRKGTNDLPGHSTYELIAGERRLRAAQQAGFDELPVRVIEVASDQEMLELALIENLQREDLNPVELARGYQRLAQDYNLTQEQISSKVGKNRATVANMLRVLDLPEPILSSLRVGEISVGHAKVILMLQGSARQSALFKKVVAGRLSVRQTEEVAKSMLELVDSSTSAFAVEKPKVQYVDQSDKLRMKLGTQVKITKKGKRGAITIEFYSDEDLERLVELLNG